MLTKSNSGVNLIKLNTLQIKEKILNCNELDYFSTGQSYKTQQTTN